MACQEIPSTTAPPMTGPSATPTPDTAPQMPIAMARRAGGTAAARSVRDSGMTAAAPTPWSVRAAISCSGDPARADATEASANSAIPPTNTRRRPSRSPSVAAAIMSDANESVYALTIHCSSCSEASSSVRSTGRAVVMTRLSSVAMNMGSDAASSATAVPTGRRERPTAAGTGPGRCRT